MLPTHINLPEIDLDDLPVVSRKLEPLPLLRKTPEDWAQLEREFNYRQSVIRYARAIGAA